MSAEVWGVIAAFAGVGAAFLAVLVGAFFWLMSAIQKLGQEIRTEFREERRERQAESQRLFDSLYRHRHDPGGAIFVPGDDG